MANLLSKKCLPCERAVPVLSRQEALTYLEGLSEWKLSRDGKAIGADYLMKDFMSAVAFIEKIAALAEKEGHHPDLHLTGYRNLKVELSTHAIGGLSLNDFILATKIGRLPKRLKGE